MLILVAVSVRLIVNSNILGTAKKAGENYEAKQAEESKLSMGGIVEEYVPTTPTITPIPTTEYIGYYADFDGKEGVDGIIYADLAVKKEETTWGNSSGIYGYEAKSNLKSYYIKEETYKGEQVQVIVPIEGTTGNDRFYVMALEDIKATIDGTEYTTFYWYNNAYSKEKLNRRVTYDYNDFGEGKINTIKMIDDWNNNYATYGEQNARDLWGVIQNRQDYEIVENETDSGKWFVPSKAEWSAYAGNLGIDKNYVNRGLSTCYWSSSQNDTTYAYYATFGYGRINSNLVVSTFCVRMSATF